MNTDRSLLLFAFIVMIFACGEDNVNPIAPDDDMMVTGSIEVLKSGNLTAQSSTNTQGMVAIVKDQKGSFFVRLSEDFNTKFSTGTVTVYLSTSQTLNLNTTTSFQLISIVGKPGEQFFSLNGPPDAKFTHGIIWCGAAGIPFGFAPFQ